MKRKLKQKSIQNHVLMATLVCILIAIAAIHRPVTQVATNANPLPTVIVEHGKSSVEVTYKTRRVEDVRFALYGETGKLLGFVDDGIQWPGEHRLSVKHANLVAGSYILRSRIGGEHYAWRIVVNTKAT